MRKSVRAALLPAFLAALGLFRDRASAQSLPPETIFYNAKVFTGEPDNPYADAVAIRADKIMAVGNVSEVTAVASQGAKRIDLAGKSLFPGFIDSHSHSMMGGLGLIPADGSEKVRQLDDLPSFGQEAKVSGAGMRGGIPRDGAWYSRNAGWRDCRFSREYCQVLVTAEVGLAPTFAIRQLTGHYSPNELQGFAFVALSDTECRPPQ